MAGFNPRSQITGLEQAQRIAQRVKNLGEDPKPLLQIAGAILEASTRRHFDTGKGPGGVPWPVSKRVEKKGGKTLVDKGILLGSVRHEVRDRSVEIGVDAIGESARHAAVLHFGSNRQTVVVGHTRMIRQAFGAALPHPVEVKVRPHGMKTNLPPRPIVGVDDDDRRDLAEAWLDHLKGLFGNGR